MRMLSAGGPLNIIRTLQSANKNDHTYWIAFSVTFHAFQNRPRYDNVVKTLAVQVSRRKELLFSQQKE